MRNSFLAVISQLGLELFIPECSAARCRLLGFARKRPACILWAVMQRAQASAICDLLADGEPEWALDELMLSAEHRGPFLDYPAGNNRGAMQ